MELLHAVTAERMKGLKRRLDLHGIAHRSTLLRAGDVFFMPGGTYHYIENNDVGDYTVLLNIDYPDVEAFTDTWDYLWNGAVWMDTDSRPEGAASEATTD